MAACAPDPDDPGQRTRARRANAAGCTDEVLAQGGAAYTVIKQAHLGFGVQRKNLGFLLQQAVQKARPGEAGPAVCAECRRALAAVASLKDDLGTWTQASARAKSEELATAVRRLERVASEAAPLLEAAREDARGQRAELNTAAKVAQLARGKLLKPFLAAGTPLALARHLASLGILTVEKDGGRAEPKEGSLDD